MHPIGCIKTHTKRKNSCPYSLFSPVLMSGSKPSSKYKKIPNIFNLVKDSCRSQTGCNRGLHRSRSFPEVAHGLPAPLYHHYPSQV